MREIKQMVILSSLIIALSSVLVTPASASIKNKEKGLPTQLAGTIYHFDKVTFKKGSAHKKIQLFNSPLERRYTYIKASTVLYSTKGVDSLSWDKKSGYPVYWGHYYVTNKSKSIKGWVFKDDVTPRKMVANFYDEFF